jgi:hypothetical protein
MREIRTNVAVRSDQKNTTTKNARCAENSTNFLGELSDLLVIIRPTELGYLVAAVACSRSTSFKRAALPRRLRR